MGAGVVTVIFTGHEYDEDTNLTYANARYYDQGVGRWLSEDPASRDNPNQFLEDPQTLNSYSYARNNPIILLDPDGQSWKTFSQGLVSPFVYAYHNPVETIATVAVGAAAVVVAPTAAAVAGVAIGGYAIGTAIGNAVLSPDADIRDYYLGQGTTAAALTGVGLKGVSTLEGASAASKNASANLGKLNKSGLLPTQEVVNPNIVNKYYNAIKNGEGVQPIEVLENSGTKYILDGHHRFIAGQEAGIEVPYVLRGTGQLKGTTWDKVKFDSFTPSE